MLREIGLELFKCFKTLSLPLQPLTLLAGVNAAGKSTIVQALLLLHQTALDSTYRNTLILDGQAISLGTLGDVVDDVNGRKQFGISLRGDDFSVSWTFGSDDKRDIAVPIMNMQLSDRQSGSIAIPSSGPRLIPMDLSLPTDEQAATAALPNAGFALAKQLTTVSYVSAERMGPRETYPLGDPSHHRTVGRQGELAPGLVSWFGDTQEVERELRNPNETSPFLFKQTQAWLSHFFPGAGFEVQAVRGANLVTLGLRTNPASDFRRPQNVGFGLSHILPIVVAVLNAKKDELILIENPEVHLHPAGQAKIGYFLARAARCGAQVVLETHSDHVLNGVRRAVRDEVLDAGKVAIHFFRPRADAEAAEQAQVVSPTIDKDGNIDHWPSDFFDQFEKDLATLAGL